MSDQERFVIVLVERASGEFKGLASGDMTLPRDVVVADICPASDSELADIDAVDSDLRERVLTACRNLSVQLSRDGFCLAGSQQATP